MDKITETLTNNPADVITLITDLFDIKLPLNTPCSKGDIDKLSTKMDAAKSSAADAVTKQTTLKAAATEKYNAAVKEIVLLNKQIAAKTVVFPKLASPIAGYKYTKVFGAPVFAHTSVSDAKFRHVASIMAEWLDNDENGCVDTPIILKHLVGKEETAYAVVKSNKADKATWSVPFEKKNLVCHAPQAENETLPNCTGLNGTNACSDATLEEVLHIIHYQGYAPPFKKQFWAGTEYDDLKTKYKNVNSTLATLLDAARGGIPRVPAVPKSEKFPAKVTAM